jgi:hypothetical protein
MLLKQHPEIVSRMTAAITAWKATLPTKPNPACVAPAMPPHRKQEPAE